MKKHFCKKEQCLIEFENECNWCGEKEMNDYALPLLVLRNLSKEYEEAMLQGNKDKCYEISVDLVEMALKLSDIAHDRTKD